MNEKQIHIALIAAVFVVLILIFEKQQQTAAASTAAVAPVTPAQLVTQGGITALASAIVPENAAVAQDGTLIAAPQTSPSAVQQPNILGVPDSIVNLDSSQTGWMYD